MKETKILQINFDTYVKCGNKNVMSVKCENKPEKNLVIEDCE